MSNQRLSWPAAFTIVAIIAIMAMAGLYVFRALYRAPGKVVEAGREVVRDLRDVAAAFSQGTVTTSFLSYATRVSGSSRLQFATLDQMELFRREDYATTLWGQLELPEIVVEATAPVQYTYYLDLEGEWHFVLEDDTVVARAPRIEFNKPAIDASSIRYEVRTGSLFRDEDAAIESLQKGLTAMAHQKAQENVDLVREVGRVKTAQFIESWLLSTWSDHDWQVRVVFADEEVPVLQRRTSGVEEVPQ